ncbi:MAG TPA: universal stress protein [Candidatus Binataceae bacterium]|nr:universal stress protein [Candidatus Binataceae bacterium]
MKNPFARILCPVDFDEYAVGAMELACRLAEDSPTVVYLLHVLVPVIPAPEQIGVPLEPFPLSEPEVRKQLEQLAREHLAGHVKYEVRTGIGDPAHVILGRIEEIGIDLVIMPTHGRRGLGRMVLGSVAEQIVRRANCPVMTVRPALAEKAAKSTGR